jgi:hypothetical protein
MWRGCSGPYGCRWSRDRHSHYATPLRSNSLQAPGGSCAGSCAHYMLSSLAPSPVASPIRLRQCGCRQQQGCVRLGCVQSDCRATRSVYWLSNSVRHVKSLQQVKCATWQRCFAQNDSAGQSRCHATCCKTLQALLPNWPSCHHALSFCNLSLWTTSLDHAVHGSRRGVSRRRPLCCGAHASLPMFA